MNETERVLWLRIALRVLSAGLVAAFIPWITLILLNARALGPGGLLAPLLRFQPYNSTYESMLAAIHLVWAIMLWRASSNPANHLLFIDFTIWANAAHGWVMLFVTPMQKGFLMTMIEGAPLFVIAAVLTWLRPRVPRDRMPARSWSLGGTAPGSAPEPGSGCRERAGEPLFAWVRRRGSRTTSMGGLLSGRARVVGRSNTRAVARS